MTQDIHAQRVLILDFGSQYTQLIARRVRELGVFCEIHPWDISDADVAAFNPRGIILSGGPASVYAEGAPHMDPAILSLGIAAVLVVRGRSATQPQPVAETAR